MSEPKNKSMQEPNENQISKSDRKRGALKCIKECDVPGVGSYKVGDTVEGHDAYLALEHHPFFQNVESEAK
ncbi:MAG: hypothetical protein DMF62_02460 [Acidobacteria bacterium]|nr:MAG: hypothetical protein DMF62_02460 [Acidobacteriota bacterium]